MERHRTIAGPPVRSATETWHAISDLAVASLDKSASIDATAVREQFDAATPAGIALIAGGYMAGTTMIVTAASLRLHVDVASGGDAFCAETDESLDAVPGAATATVWSVHIDPPAVLTATVADVLAGLSNFFVGLAPADNSDQRSKSTTAVHVDLDSFSKMGL